MTSKASPNTELANTVQYGQAILKNNTSCPLAIISKKLLDVEKKILNKANVLTRWFKYLDRIYLSIYWPEEKKGLVFPFDKGNRQIIQSIIRKKSLAISNSFSGGKILMVNVLKTEPLKWMKKEMF